MQRLPTATLIICPRNLSLYRFRPSSVSHLPHWFQLSSKRFPVYSLRVLAKSFRPFVLRVSVRKRDGIQFSNRVYPKSVEERGKLTVVVSWIVSLRYGENSPREEIFHLLSFSFIYDRRFKLIIVAAVSLPARRLITRPS